MAETKLNLGCGELYRQGYINADMYANKADIKFNFNKYKYPFKDSQFNEVCFYKCIMNIDDVSLFLKEMHRIIRDKGILKISDNYYNSQGGHGPNVKTFCTLETFKLLNIKKYYWLNSGNQHFKVRKITLKYTPLGQCIPFEWLRRKVSVVFGEIASEIYYELENIKPNKIK